MNGQYTGTASLGDGRELRVSGSILECANWAENVIRANGGEIVIQITRVEE